MEPIKIICGKESIFVPLDSDGTLSLECLKEYFPAAHGLTFETVVIDEVVSQGLFIKDNKIIIQPNVTVYKVHFALNERSKEGALNNVECSRDNIIAKYFHENYSYNEIISILQEYGITLSYRQLQRVLKASGLHKKYLDENLYKIISAILNELQGSGRSLGYKSLFLRLKGIYGLQVYRSTVYDLLSILDPSGMQQRARYKLKRRVYSVPGPNFIWHLDGYDKLKPLGFAIHGCVDGFSRKVLWLELATTNNKPEVICYYYLKTVKNLKLLPTIIRSDHSTENSIIENVHQALRFSHQDKYSGINSFIKGKSTANQRIESFWGRMRRHSMNFRINFFKDMRSFNHFDKSNPIELECLRFCFGPLIKYDLCVTRREWNRHSIRKQNFSTANAGKPNFLFYVPSAHNAQNYSHPVNEEHIKNAFDAFTEEPMYCNPVFTRLVEDLLENVSFVPKSLEEATILYHKIINELKKVSLQLLKV